MPIEGPLRELGIHDVFQLLDLSRKTGALRVSSELRDDEGMVFFDGGRVVQATIRSTAIPTEVALLQAGRITEGDIARALDRKTAAPGARWWTSSSRSARSPRRSSSANCGCASRAWYSS